MQMGGPLSDQVIKIRQMSAAKALRDMRGALAAHSKIPIGAWNNAFSNFDGVLSEKNISYARKGNLGRTTFEEFAAALTRLSNTLATETGFSTFLTSAFDNQTGKKKVCESPSATDLQSNCRVRETVTVFTSDVKRIYDRDLTASDIGEKSAGAKDTSTSSVLTNWSELCENDFLEPLDGETKSNAAKAYLRGELNFPLWATRHVAVERSSVLSELDRAFRSIHAAILAGPIADGKTTTALQFAYRWLCKGRRVFQVTDKTAFDDSRFVSALDWNAEPLILIDDVALPHTLPAYFAPQPGRATGRLLVVCQKRRLNQNRKPLGHLNPVTVYLPQPTSKDADGFVDAILRYSAQPPEFDHELTKQRFVEALRGGALGGLWPAQYAATHAESLEDRMRALTREIGDQSDIDLLAFETCVFGNWVELQTARDNRGHSRLLEPWISTLRGIALNCDDSRANEIAETVPQVGHWLDGEIVSNPKAIRNDDTLRFRHPSVTTLLAEAVFGVAPEFKWETWDEEANSNEEDEASSEEINHDPHPWNEEPPNSRWAFLRALGKHIGLWHVVAWQEHEFGQACRDFCDLCIRTARADARAKMEGSSKPGLGCCVEIIDLVATHPSLDSVTKAWVELARAEARDFATRFAPSEQCQILMEEVLDRLNAALANVPEPHHQMSMRVALLMKKCKLRVKGQDDAELDWKHFALNAIATATSEQTKYRHRKTYLNLLVKKGKIPFADVCEQMTDLGIFSQDVDSAWEFTFLIIVVGAVSKKLRLYTNLGEVETTGGKQQAYFEQTDFLAKCISAALRKARPAFLKDPTLWKGHELYPKYRVLVDAAGLVQDAYFLQLLQSTTATVDVPEIPEIRDPEDPLAFFVGDQLAAKMREEEAARLARFSVRPKRIRAIDT
jgi:hypothetical protein